MCEPFLDVLRVWNEEDIDFGVKVQGNELNTNENLSKSRKTSHEIEDTSRDKDVSLMDWHQDIFQQLPKWRWKGNMPERAV